MRKVCREVRRLTPTRTTLTQTQLQELLETEPARALLEGAEERGFVLPAELEAFALEHDLADDEVEQLTRELEDQRPRGA